MRHDIRIVENDGSEWTHHYPAYPLSDAIHYNSHHRRRIYISRRLCVLGGVAYVLLAYILITF